MINFEDMKDALQLGECKVDFTKKNGDQRDMRCTLNFDLIPVEAHPAKIDLNLSEGVDRTIRAVRVFDLDKKEWRSFLMDSVRFFNGEKGPIHPPATNGVFPE